MTRQPIAGTANVYALFPDQAPADVGLDRLARATRSIVEAVAEQKTAVAAFRETLDELRQSTDKLHRSSRDSVAHMDRVGDTLADRKPRELPKL